MTLYKWSQTAANNGTADSTCPFPEGMAPSAVNDGVRGAMAAVAKFRDDTAGAIVTSGTLTAYSLFSFQGFDTLADLSGKIIAFSPHVTSGATVTLEVDGLGPKPLRASPGVEIVEGTLIEGTPYVAVYNNTDGAFYLHGFCSSPYNVPFLGGMDFWDTVAPNSAFIFPLGQAISRTVYSKAFARWGTTFGVGDGATTFNAPNKAGRVSAMIDATASTLNSFSIPAGAGVLGATGGGQAATLTTPNLPPYTPSGSVNTQISPDNSGIRTGAGTGPINVGGSGNGGGQIELTAASQFNGNAQGGQSTPFSIVQPTIVCNYIIRII